jgi:hypothetical protein
MPKLTAADYEAKAAEYRKKSLAEARKERHAQIERLGHFAVKAGLDTLNTVTWIAVCAKVAALQDTPGALAGWLSAKPEEAIMIHDEEDGDVA